MIDGGSDSAQVGDSTFFIAGEFGDDMRDAVVADLYSCIEKLSTKKSSMITLYISSNGGDAYLLMDIVALVELAKRRGIKVRTIVASHAYSAGSMLAVTGTVGERYIARGAEHLAHYGQFDGYRKSTPLQSTREHEHNLRWNNHMVNHYKKYCKIPQLKSSLSDDGFYITAEQSIEWGLADKYIEELE